MAGVTRIPKLALCKMRQRLKFIIGLIKNNGLAIIGRALAAAFGVVLHWYLIE